LQTNALEYLQASAARFPDKAAFVDESSSFTFAEMNLHAQGLGTYISRHTESINRPIAILAERTATCLCAFMGVLYSGNYYVPVDAKMPVDRINSILSQLDPLFVLYSDATHDLAKSLEDTCPMLSIAEGFLTAPDDKLIESRVSKVLDIDPVYVIFTSGSTGLPKGIVISHRAVIDFTEWMADTFEFSHKDVLANQAPFYFDLSVKDIYLTFKTAATTHIIPRRTLMFPIMTMRFIEDVQATALVWATAAFHLLANSGVLDKIAPKSLDKIILGGEALYAKQLNIWRAALPDIKYVNLYGPTEVTVDCTYYKIDREYADHEVIPIGIPCENKEVLLLDDELKPVPQGQPGEICVRGIGLARGYYGDATKTSAAFVQNPANLYYPDVIYRTGDIGVLNENGLFVYLSRKDGQIKRAGYRIELGEIETALSALPEMRENACFFDADEDKIICAYAGDIDTDGIIASIRDILPKYMFPNIFVQKDNLPHNANGKIDRVQLKDEYFNGKT